ncbi:MAG TPA: hypothetical protein VFX83_11430, partial [Azonexus sp.]|nr:hypothetical protein [Azonexus sp.]
MLKAMGYDANSKDPAGGAIACHGGREAGPDVVGWRPLGRRNVAAHLVMRRIPGRQPHHDIGQ